MFLPTPYFSYASIFPIYAWNIGNKMQFRSVMCLSITLRKGKPTWLFPAERRPGLQRRHRLSGKYFSRKSSAGIQAALSLSWLMQCSGREHDPGARSLGLKPGSPLTSGFHLIPLKLRLSQLQNGNNSTYSMTLLERSSELIRDALTPATRCEKCLLACLLFGFHILAGSLSGLATCSQFQWLFKLVPPLTILLLFSISMSVSPFPLG